MKRRDSRQTVIPGMTFDTHTPIKPAEGFHDAPLFRQDADAADREAAKRQTVIPKESA